MQENVVQSLNFFTNDSAAHQDLQHTRLPCPSLSPEFVQFMSIESVMQEIGLKISLKISIIWRAVLPVFSQNHEEFHSWSPPELLSGVLKVMTAVVCDSILVEPGGQADFFRSITTIQSHPGGPWGVVGGCFIPPIPNHLAQEFLQEAD